MTVSIAARLIRYETPVTETSLREQSEKDMKARRYRWLTATLAALVGTSASAQIIRPESGQICGPEIRTDQVMVLDLRPFGGRDIGGQRAFIRKHAGNYVPAHKDVKIVLVPQPVGATDVDAALRQSQIEAAKHGCDLVLVYRTEIRDSAHSGGWFATAEVQFATRSR